MVRKRSFKKISLLTLPNAIVSITTALLIISVVAEILVPTYKTNPALYGLMGLIVGAMIKSVGR